MLFSCLSMRIFLIPKRLCLGKTADRSQWQNLEVLVDNYMTIKMSKAEPSQVNRLRASILQDCRTAAKNAKGIYTLTVPTGGGKTLSCNGAFALDHAIQHCMQRIIVAIPYTSIVEQTIETIQEIFRDNVLDITPTWIPFPLRKAPRVVWRLKTGSADVVTTNVQLLGHFCRQNQPLP